MKVFLKQECIGYIPKDMVAEFGLTPWANSDGEISEQVICSLRGVAGSARLKPRQCLNLVSEEL